MKNLFSRKRFAHASGLFMGMTILILFFPLFSFGMFSDTEAPTDDTMLVESNQEPNPPLLASDSLVLHLPFNGDAMDVSGNGNDGTVFGANLVKDRFGNEKSAYGFDAGDYIEAQSAQFGTLGEEVTISFWMKTTAGKIPESFLSLHADGMWQWYNFRWDGGSIGDHGTFGFAIYRNYGGVVAYIRESVEDDQWHHIVGVRKGNTLTSYKDGSRMSSMGSVNPFGPQDQLSILTVGHPGVVDDVRIYKKALSDDEIQKLYLEDETPSVNNPPVASFTYTPENPVASESITFDASNSYDPDGLVESYAWSFYYSDSEEGYCEPSSGKITSFSYPSAGNYAVSLNVSDDNQSYSTTTKVITVLPMSENTPPTLSFPESGPYTNGVDPDTGDADTLFTFNVVYQDQDNDLPESICLITKGITNSLNNRQCVSRPSFSPDGDYITGVELLSDGFDGYQRQLSKYLEAGEYEYYFEASDGTDTVRFPEMGSLSLVVKKTLENEPPVIVVNEPNPLELLVDEQYIFKPVIATDPEDGDISDSIVYGGNYNTGTAIPGTYDMTFTVTDSGGLTTAETLVIIVKELGNDFEPFYASVRNNGGIIFKDIEKEEVINFIQKSNDKNESPILLAGTYLGIKGAIKNFQCIYKIGEIDCNFEDNCKDQEEFGKCKKKMIIKNNELGWGNFGPKTKQKMREILGIDNLGDYFSQIGFVKNVPNWWIFQVVEDDNHKWEEQDSNNNVWWHVQEVKSGENNSIGWIMKKDLKKDFLEKVSPDSFFPNSVPNYFDDKETIGDKEITTHGIGWVIEQVEEGDNSLKGYCLKFVQKAFNVGTTAWGCPATDYSGNCPDGAFVSDSPIKYYIPANPIENWNPPIGSLMFYSINAGSYMDYGHIGIYLGNSEVAHINYDGKPTITNTVNMSSLWASTPLIYRGWAFPDVLSEFKVGDTVKCDLADCPIRGDQSDDNPASKKLAKGDKLTIVLDNENWFYRDGYHWWRVKYGENEEDEGWCAETGVNIHLKSPGYLRVYDSHGRITGLVNGEAQEEIPFSTYDKENKKITISSLFPDTYIYEVVGMDEDVYGLEIETIGGGNEKFIATDIFTTPDEVHQYSINWQALSQNEEGVTVKIDKDGDGEFEHSVEVGSEFSDLVAPETQITTSGTEGNNSWFKSDAEITLSAKDNGGGVGVQKTEYSLDGGNTWNEYADKFTISDEGIRTIQYRSMDWFNNFEEAKTQEIKIDKTAPEANISFNEQEKNLAITGIDNLSDVAVARDGKKDYILTDEAGNTLALYFERIIKRKKIIGAFLKGMRYNDDEKINVPRTTLFYGWNTKKDGILRYLFQKVKVKGKCIGKALYHYRPDKTFTIIKVKGEKPVREIFDGLKKINLTTNLGELDFSFK